MKTWIDLRQSPLDKQWRAWAQIDEARLGIDEEGGNVYVWVVVAVHRKRKEALRIAMKEMERL